jgi:lysozyme family protein
MAFEDDYEFMMDNEDKNQLHAIVPDAPPGAHAISGINSAAFPKQFAAIAAIPQAQRGPAVEQFYQAEFWNQWIAQITSTDLQERVFDTAVNSGMGTAVKILQTAVNSFHDENPLIVDGAWGPVTVAAANACNPLTLVPAFEQARVAHLRKYDANSPYLAQLIARAEK